MVNLWQQIQIFGGAEGLPGRRKVERAANVIQIAFPTYDFLTIHKDSVLSSWLFSPALWALLSEMLESYFCYCPGIASLSLEWAHIRKDPLSFYLAWGSDLLNPASLGGSDIPKSSLGLLPQPKMSNSHSPYLNSGASWVRWGKGWWCFLRPCVYLRRTVSPTVQFGLGEMIEALVPERLISTGLGAHMHISGSVTSR